MGDDDKDLVWLRGEVKTPPFSATTRRAAGLLLRRLQRGDQLSLPHSRPMPSISAGCHELRLTDSDRSVEWRIIYRVDSDAILIGEVFQKTTQRTPARVIDSCKKRFRDYDASE